MDQPMFLRDAPRPITLQHMFKGLRFPEPLERIAPNVADEIVDRRKNFPVGCLPVQVFLPRVGGPANLHCAEEGASSGSINSCSDDWPLSACLIDSSRRTALAGLRRRCTVSINPS